MGQFDYDSLDSASRVPGRRALWGALLAIVALLLPMTAQAEDDHVGPPAVVSRSHEQSLRVDAATIARDQRRNPEDVYQQLRRQESFGELTEELAADYPDTFGGGWTGEGINGELFVRFTGEIPPGARTAATDRELDVNFLGGADNSMRELRTRTDSVHSDLLAHGYASVATAFSVAKEKIIATATRRAGDHRSDRERRAELSADSRAPDVSLTFTDDIVGGYTHTYGGDKLLHNGTWQCTSGFTVYSATTYGVSTAAHCTGLDEYQQEDGLTYSTSYKFEHRGDWGDMEWHTTSHSEFPEFYSDVGWRREAQYLESAGNINEDDLYCKFGRQTGYHCDDVYLTWVNVTFDGYTHRRLVAMDNNIHRGGDSGGPWFIGNTAAGIVSGWVELNGIRYDTWSKADFLDEALAVNVLLTSS